MFENFFHLLINDIFYFIFAIYYLQFIVKFIKPLLNNMRIHSDKAVKDEAGDGESTSFEILETSQVECLVVNSSSDEQGPLNRVNSKDAKNDKRRASELEEASRPLLKKMKADATTKAKPQRRGQAQKGAHANKQLQKMNVEDPSVEHMATRYKLYYVDDVVCHAIQAKCEVQYQPVRGDDLQLDEEFKQELREEGIYFDINVSPAQPENREQERSQAAQFNILVQPSGEEQDQSRELLSPTFKLCSNEPAPDQRPNLGGGFDSQQPPLRRDTLQHSDSEQYDGVLSGAENERNMDEMLLSPTLSMKQHLEHGAGGHGRIASLEGPNDLRRVGLFIGENYESPTLRDIKLAQRRREIDEIDEKVKNKATKETSKRKHDLQKLHLESSKALAPMSPMKYSKSPEVRGRGQKQSATSQFIGPFPGLGSVELTKDADQPGAPPAKGVPERSESEHSESKARSRQSDRFEDFMPFGCSNKMERLVSFKKKSAFIHQSNIIGHDDTTRDITQRQTSIQFPDFKKLVIQEPKSGLLRRGTLGQNQLQRSHLARSGMKNEQRSSNANLCQETYDINSNNSQESASVNSSSPSHTSDDAIRLNRMQSIYVSKLGVGERKLLRQNMMRQKELSSGVSNANDDQSSLVQSRQNSQFKGELQADQSRLHQESISQLACKGHQSQINFKIGQPKMAQITQFPMESMKKSHELSLKKIETEQPFKPPGLVDSLTTSANKVTKAQSKRGTNNEGDKSMQMKGSKHTSNQIFKQSLNNNLKKQRRKDIKKLYKSTAEQEESRFVKNQQRQMIILKKLAEERKCKKITKNCFEPEVEDGDTTQGDVTVKQNSVFFLQDSNPWINGMNNLINQQQSFNSRDQSVSTPQQKKGGDSQKQRDSIMSHTKSDHQTQGQRHSGPQSQLNLKPKLTLQNHLTDGQFEITKKKSAKHLLEGRDRSDTFEINGVQNAVQFNLQIVQQNFSHRSKSHSSKSAASIVYDLISQQSRHAADLQRMRSKYDPQKKVSIKNTISNFSPDKMNKNNRSTLLAQVADQQKLKSLLEQNKKSQELLIAQKINRSIQKQEMFKSNAQEYPQYHSQQRIAEREYPLQNLGTGKFDSQIFQVDQPLNAAASHSSKSSSRNYHSPYLPNEGNVDMDEQFFQKQQESFVSRNNSGDDKGRTQSFGKVNSINTYQKEPQVPFQMQVHPTKRDSQMQVAEENMKLEEAEDAEATYQSTNQVNRVQNVVERERVNKLAQIPIMNTSALEQRMEVDDAGSNRKKPSTTSQQLARVPPRAPNSSANNLRQDFEEEKQRFESGAAPANGQAKVIDGSNANKVMLISQQNSSQLNKNTDKHVLPGPQADPQTIYNRSQETKPMYSRNFDLLEQSSKSGSEFSFKKLPPSKNKYQQADLHNRFEISLGQVKQESQNWSVMMESPQHLNKLLVNSNANSPSKNSKNSQHFHLNLDQSSQEVMSISSPANRRADVKVSDVRYLKNISSSLRSGLQDIMQDLDSKDAVANLANVQVLDQKDYHIQHPEVHISNEDGSPPNQGKEDTLAAADLDRARHKSKSFKESSSQYVRNTQNQQYLNHNQQYRKSGTLQGKEEERLSMQTYQSSGKAQNANAASSTNANQRHNYNKISKYEQEYIEKQKRLKQSVPVQNTGAQQSSFERDANLHKVNLRRPETLTDNRQPSLKIGKQKSMNESAEKIRKIEAQLKDNSNSNDTILDPVNNPYTGTDRNTNQSRQTGTGLNSFANASEDERRTPTKVPKKQTPSLQLNTTAMQSKHSQHANRLSMVTTFNLKQPQFSESPMKNQVRKEVDDDLDELQSIFTRHHNKQKNQRRGQSNYGAKSFYTANQPSRKLQHKNIDISKNQVELGRDRTQSHDLLALPHQSQKMYKINDKEQDDASIFNEGQSHLNDDLVDFIPSRVQFKDAIQAAQAKPNQRIQSYQPSTKNSNNMFPSKERNANQYQKGFEFSVGSSLIATKQVSVLSADKPQAAYPYAQQLVQTQKPTRDNLMRIQDGEGAPMSSTHNSNQLKQEFGQFQSPPLTAAWQQNDSAGPFDQSIDSRKSKVQQFLKKSKPQLPVYYDSHAGTRFSILSEMVQAQPYRPPNQPASTQQNIFEEAGSGDGSIGHHAYNSGSKGSNPKSRKSGTSGHTGKWGGGASQPGNRYENLKIDSPKITEDDDEDMPGSPFEDLRLKSNLPSEPANAKYINERQQLLRR